MKIAAKQTVKTYVGADDRVLYFLAKQGDGTAFNLTDYTVTMKAVLGATTKINASACTVTNAALGAFTYTPTAAEIDEAGQYEAQVKLSLTVGEVTTVNYLDQFILEVLAVL